MKDGVRSLSRVRAVEHGGGFDGEGPRARAARERARDYLAARMLRPGGNPLIAVETELDAMTQRERVFLEIEMSEKAEAAHSYDYDPSGWNR